MPRYNRNCPFLLSYPTVSQTFFQNGTPQITAHIPSPAPTYEKVYGPTKLIAGSAFQLLLNYCQENLFVKR